MKSFFKRTIYLGYYFKQMKWEQLKKFLKYTAKETGRSQSSLLTAAISDVYKYNISVLEYFQFGFYKLPANEKENWAGTGTMYEFQRITNPVSERNILENKLKFYKHYREFFVHHLYSIEELESNSELIEELYANNERLVLKEVEGKTGTGVKVIRTQELPPKELLSYMKSNNYGLLETYILQHKAIQELSPSAVNTIRIFTQIRTDGSFEILGCRMRISVNSPVDNMAAGNLAAPIDEKTGKINGPGVYSDITKQPESVHPVTGVSIVGFQIPFWTETLDMIKKASLKHTQNRSIGWDVVITDNGPGLIEGNHDWCKLVWQMPVNRGLKGMLEI